MKKLIFVIESMNVGGTEKALLSMLHEIPRNKYEITVLILEKHGEFLDKIPSWINVKFLEDYIKVKNNIDKAPKQILFELLEKNKFIEAFKLLFNYMMWRIFNNKNYYYNKQILNLFDKLTETYDVAISYQGPPSDFSAYFVVNKINSKSKVQWIHSDVEKLYLDIEGTNKLYNMFDKIFVVSEAAKHNFMNLFNIQNDKVEVFSNILSSNLIKEEAKKGKGFDDKFEGVRILTVGRLSGEKGQKLTISVLARLRKEGYNVRWYCIGEGELRKTYENLIIENKVQDNYILLGSKTNPYKYFEECDIYVQSSMFEGYCLTLAEARVFNKAIVSTDFVGAKEQLINKETGLIVNYNEDEIYSAIKKILDDEMLKIKLQQNLSKKNIDTTTEINKLYNFIESV